MNRMDFDSVRKTMTAISAATVIFVAGILVFPVVDSFGGVSVDGTDSLDITYDGVRIVLDGDISVKSNLHSDVSDLSLDLYALDPSDGAKTLLCSVKDLDLPAGKTVSVPVSGNVAFWPLFNIVNGDLDSDQSKLCFKAVTSFTYVFGLVHANADVDISYRLSEPGKTVSYSFLPATEHDMVMKVENLAKYLVPETLGMTFTKDTDSLDVSIGADDAGILAVEAHTAGNLDSVLSDMCQGGYTVTVTEGVWNGPADDILTLLHYLRDIQ